MSREARPPEPMHFGFLLLPRFSMLSFSCAVEVLRMANYTAERTQFTWDVLTLDRQPVRCRNGMQLSPWQAPESSGRYDVFFVCSDRDVDQGPAPELERTLDRIATTTPRLGGICTGAYALAQCGLIDDQRCTVHRDYLDRMRREFRRLNLTGELFEIDGDRYTCVGGTASLHMMLHLVEERLGSRAAFAIAEQFVLQRIKGFGEVQHFSVRIEIPDAPAYLSTSISLMQNNIQDPLRIDELAGLVGISNRQLERSFTEFLDTTPVSYYLALRLQHARKMLRDTRLRISDIAAACGFNSLQHFSKCYRTYYQVKPSTERTQGGER